MLEVNSLFIFLNLFYTTGEPEPSHIPSANALRVAKCREKKARLLHEDPYVALAMMKYCDPYRVSIHSISMLHYKEILFI